MLERHPPDNTITFQCDGCSDALETEQPDLRDAARIAFKMAWKTVPPSLSPSGRYEHFCPSCHAKDDPFPCPWPTP